jgi:CRISPR-associated protein Csd1
MMLRALYDLAQRQNLLESPDYEKKKVDLYLRIDAEGLFLGLEPAGEKLGKGKPIEVPRLPSRTVGVKAGLLFDNAKYVLGVGGDDGKEDRLERCAAAFREEVVAAAAKTQDAGVLAVLKFLDRLPEQRAAVLAQYPFGKSTDWTGSENIAFRVDPDETLVHSRPAVREYFAAQRASSESGGLLTRCLVTGQRAVPTRLHPAVKRIPQAQTSGAMLVSFNSDAFLSQGVIEDTNAPVSRAAAEGYVTALNWLLEGTPNRRFRYGVPLGDDAVMVFWTQDPNSIVDELAELYGGPDPSDEKQKLAVQVQSIGDAVWKGKPPAEETDTAFYAVTLSGHARVIVRDWIATTAKEVRHNLRQFAADLRIGSTPDQPLPLPLLLSSLKSKARTLPPQLVTRMVRAAFHNEPLPRQILVAALDRIRLPPDNFDRFHMHRRCALIKAALLRSPTRSPEWEVTVSLDEDNREVPYLLGRLFAVLEQLQEAALGSVNASIRDRYFGAASMTPGLTFPRLLKLSIHHAAKAERVGQYLEKIKSSIMAGLPAATLPRLFDLNQQGLFAIGYYHQREKRFEKGVVHD